MRRTNPIRLDSQAFIATATELLKARALHHPGHGAHGPAMKGRVLYDLN
jgi:hypothetical protein